MDEKFLNKIICGDSLDLLKRMPENSVDLIITSPPYFNLRDYGTSGQIGTENTVAEYLERLIEIFTEAHRILKTTGSLWLNINDVYSKQYRKNTLMCIPDRLKIALVDRGWILRNEIIWRKPNAMPCSAKNRFNNDFEKFYFFVKTDEYKFKTQYEPMISKPAKKQTHKINKTKYQSIKQETSVRQGMNRERGLNVIALRKELPAQEEFVNFIRKTSDVDTIELNSNIKRTKIEHWFRRDKKGFAYPSTEDWNAIKWMLDDFSEEFMEIDRRMNEVTYETDSILKNSDQGRIKRAVWNISTKAFKGSHYAPFPEELVKTPILACTDENDLVLDIFSGSETTCAVAKKMKRNYLGFDISPEFCKIAEKRVSEAMR